MAIVSIPDQNKTLQEPAEIKAFLAGIDIDYDHWEPVELGDMNDASAILAAYAQQIERVKEQGGYTSVDVINVNSLTPGLDEMLTKFNREHWHDEDEVRFTVRGRGLFHISPQEHPPVSVEVGPGDMIRVPRGTHHWFNLCGSRQITTVRFFQNKEGWTPHYTHSHLEEKYQPVCFGPEYISA
jgi:1,2-dihydroxy-3-keto-5-methylthiopentene dioxygenase